MKQKVENKFLLIFRFIKTKAKQVPLPFMEGMSLYDVISFFVRGIVEGNVTTRASSLAFSFFLAIFPAILFLFTLIPYIRIDGFQMELFELMQDIMPPQTYEVARSTIDDILTQKQGGLLSIGFIFTLLFATNGVYSIITNFSQSVHQIDFRSFWQQYIVAVGLTVILSVLLFLSIAVLMFTDSVGNYFVELDYFSGYVAELLQLGRILILVLLVQTSVSILIYFGPTKHNDWHFFSPGSLLATSLIIVSSLLFAYYVNNFSQYNRLYGSIGTLMIIMLWIYVNSLVLIIGFELDASIQGVKKKIINDISEEEPTHLITESNSKK